MRVWQNYFTYEFYFCKFMLLLGKSLIIPTHQASQKLKKVSFKTTQLPPWTWKPMCIPVQATVHPCPFRVHRYYKIEALVEDLLGAGRPSQAEGLEVWKPLVSTHPQRHGTAMGPATTDGALHRQLRGRQPWVCGKHQTSCWLGAITGPVDLEQEAGVVILTPFPWHYGCYFSGSKWRRIRKWFFWEENRHCHARQTSQP